MRRLLDGLITGLALVFFIPTMLVLASWNAIPGDSLYPLKTSLENVTLAALSGTHLLPKASIKFTNRRMNEATTLLSKRGSTVGYDLLVANAEQTQTFIAENGDAQSATQFSDSIDVYKKQIQETRAKVASGIPTQQTQAVSQTLTSPTPQSATLTTPTTQTSTTNSQTVVINVPTTVTIQHEDPKEVVQKLNETEQKLNEIQKKVKEKADNENKGKENNQGNQLGKDNNSGE